MARTSTFAFQEVQATVNGLPVEGFTDGDDVVSIERNADIGTGKVGADGSTIFSASSDRAAMITLRLFDTSITHKRLQDLLNVQRNQPNATFPFNVVNLITNEGGTADKCSIHQAPPPSFGKEASDREWVLWTGEWQENIMVENI